MKTGKGLWKILNLHDFNYFRSWICQNKNLLSLTNVNH
jgi:hypothetical protein